jgi:histidinol-phosphate aminotransferase
MPAMGVRADLEELEPYVSPQRPGWNGARLNTNESPYPPPEAVIETFLERMREVAFHRYPDRDATVLITHLADHLGRPRESLWLANGSNEVFLHLFLAFGGPGRSVLVFEPTYSLHTMIPRIAGTSVVVGRRSEDFTIDVPYALRTIDESDPNVIVLCSPNNPTGGVEPRPALEAILERASGLVIVDEAYVDFARLGTSALDLLDTHANLVVVRTFSKAWSLAGARLGYLLAAPELVSAMGRVRLPYHLSTPTQLLGEAVLSHMPEVTASIDKVVTERDRLTVGLQSLGVKTYPSDANFVLFEVENPERVWNGLLDRGVLIRRYEGVPKLERCLRVTAGLPEETDVFLQAARELRDE